MKSHKITLNNKTEFANLITIINKNCESSPFELYPFKVGCYNSYLKHKNLHLNYNKNTLAFVIINKPSFYGIIINQFKKHPESIPTSNPMDTTSRQMVANYIEEVKYQICDFFDTKHLSYTILHDENVDAQTKLPHVHCQTAGHASGAIFYYMCKNKEEEDVVNHCEKVGCCGEIKKGIDVSQYFLSNRKPKGGVSFHPQFGGWFSFSGITIFPTIRVDSKNEFFKKIQPRNLFENNNKLRLYYMHLYKSHSFDHRYRDLINPKYKYSEEAELFFSSPFSQRSQVLKDLLKNYTSV